MHCFIIGGEREFLSVMISNCIELSALIMPPSAAAMLKTISDRIQDFPATAYTAYLSLVVQMAWMIFWVWTATLVERITGNAAWAVAFFVLLSLYWTIQGIHSFIIHSFIQ